VIATQILQWISSQFDPTSVCWFSIHSLHILICFKWREPQPQNISGTLGCRLVCHFLFLPHFDVICDLLQNRRTATRIFNVAKVFPISPLFLHFGESYLYLLLPWNPFLKRDWSIFSETCNSENHENRGWLVKCKIKFRDFVTRPTTKPFKRTCACN